MVIDISIFILERCCKLNTCCDCDLWLGDNNKTGCTCALTICEKEYEKISKNHLTS